MGVPPVTAPDGPLTPDGLRVCAEMCSDCVFRPNNLMHLRAGRLAQMVRDSLKQDSFIPCHQTLDGERAVCRGFWDRHKNDTLGCRLGQILGVIETRPE
jgi:hypothetical protein